MTYPMESAGYHSPQVGRKVVTVCSQAQSTGRTPGQNRAVLHPLLSPYWLQNCRKVGRKLKREKVRYLPYRYILPWY